MEHHILPGQGQLRTHIVEDNPTICENLLATLEKLVGAVPSSFANTACQGYQWLTDGTWRSEEFSPRCIDLIVKQSNSLGVISACRQRQPIQKTVVPINYATADIRARCHKLDVDAVFNKSNEIKALIESCLALNDDAEA